MEKPSPYYFRHGGADDLDNLLPCGLAPQSCPVCSSTSQLLFCGGCKVVSYCGKAHQLTDRPNHKAVCITIKKTGEKLDREEAELRAKPADSLLPADVFNTSAGRFWGILDTRNYMRARFAAADALLKVETRVAVERALGHFMEMLRLCRADNLGVRDVVPALLLRLGREQECYDFLKWWATADLDGKYRWGDTTLPYLDVHGADAFEPIEPFLPNHGLSLSQLAMLTLLKLRLRLDLESHGSESGRPVGRLVRAKVRFAHTRGISRTTEELKSQYYTLCRVINDANPHFWEALVNGETPSPPASYGVGSRE
ncbi:hypothetical protein B0T25DRAFT_228171 [Lasiosphaeria hispida]|uniref:MYND-type domain-containing protein n=1 Tax=Lasiosphaeria hispida TaxID=260671 RepID=A0AAJ0MBN3_9PEZI|nr:hypothetical protein B0T25DRAFT_228171 [Lasiosphaeria hispida]